ncbi:Hpc2-related domain-containing protein [Caenorhabditis elegans]|uniref:Hpc2-related domain-containing protein n=3 Tax=Caenorhabditis elegans TaxID=6239 RepID=C7IVS5_CAEEL|nr:Hpc2-related domain-containing protein [Caenorhabditis elegans]CBB16282.1 Hpc2-related domain-containing protein [Caenorhabditis elegans]|eukprot:NP_001255178.1 Prion-like-(Q/N-rich)-domain-bearing protein [Caenorhabditis elegans]
MDSLGSSKKKKKAEKSAKNEVIQIRISVAKPGSKKYTHVDWEELLKNNGKERDEDDLRRFYDEDTLFMAKKLGETRSKSGKKLRVNLDQLQHFNRKCGYDMDDDFIDDTEIVDDEPTTSKKGGFYVGKGDVKDSNDEDEEEEEETDVEESIQEVPKKVKIRKIKEKSGEKSSKSSDSSSSSSSDSEDAAGPPRMTGAPPSIRMVSSSSSLKKLPAPRKPSPPPAVEPTRSVEIIEKPEKTEKPAEKRKTAATTSALEPAEKKKKPDSSSSSEEIILIDDNAPAAKKQPESAQKGSTTVTMSAKKICKQQEEIAKQKPSSSSVTPSKPAAPTASTPKKEEIGTLETFLKNIFANLDAKGKLYQEKKLKTFDTETLKEITTFIDVMKHHKTEKVNMEPLIYSLAKSFGMTTQEVMKQVEQEISSKKATTPKPSTNAVLSTISSQKSLEKNAADWKLTQTDLPTMGEKDIQMLTTIVRSWKSKKEISNSMVTGWLKDVNQLKMNADQARKKFFDIINTLPDSSEKNGGGGQQDANDIPKHERSRKARMFLHQWVYLSRKFLELQLPKLKHHSPPVEGLAKKQVIAANAIKEGVRKQISLFENKKDRLPGDPVYVFQFTEPVLTAVAPYLEDLVDYALAAKKIELIVSGIDALHQSTDGKITIIQFYIEICRRLQKLSFLAVEEPMKSRLKEANEQIMKHQVVQIPKYQLKWPDGQAEPSLKGLNRELYEFDKSILSMVAAKPSAPATPKASSSTALRPSTSSTPSQQQSTSTAKAMTSSSTSAEDAKRLLAMNQLVQVYAGKYLLPTGNSTADICDPTICLMNDDILLIMVTAVYSCGIPLVNQMNMLKNVLCQVGQTRMAQTLATQKTQNKQCLTQNDYQLLFDYFGKFEKALEQRKAKKEEAERLKKLEEKLKKEKEKQAEKDRIEAKKFEERMKKEQEKQEEKERKEREKREEKERKEREIREIMERKKREEDDRIAAKLQIAQQLENDRKMREAEESARKETERRAKMETERKVAEARRAVERENQIKMMRAQQLQRRQEEAPPPQQAPAPHTQKIQVKNEPVDHSFDILKEAEKDAHIIPTKSIKAEPLDVQKPLSAFEKLASLRGRTQSADMRRGGDSTEMPNVTQQYQAEQNHLAQSSNNSQYNAPSTSSQPQHFPTEPSIRQPPPQQSYNSNQMLQNPRQQPQNQIVQNFQSAPQRHPHQNPQIATSSSSGGVNQFYNNGGAAPPVVEQQAANRRSSFTMSHSVQQHQSPLQQQFPINSYQSPSHHNNSSSMSNSSLMQTPHSNSSMIARSPQFPSHTSPMSQRFHTPPSVGHQMVQSPLSQPNPSPLQHFNFSPHSSSFSSQRPQMPPQRQMSQQNLMHQQQQPQNHTQHQYQHQTFSSQQQQLQQHQHQIRHQMNTNYPPPPGYNHHGH